MTPIDPDELARQAPFLRRLARRLVADEARADDVEQEAWLAVLETPRAPRETGPWLARVARNAAIKMSRTDERRRRREAEAARPESFPGARVEEAAERAAVQRELTDLLLALEEPYRAVLLLRYFEDLPPRAIASELGLPVGTVHTRILRGRERLRRKLTERHGDPSEWLPMLVQFSRDPGPALPAPAAPREPAGILRNGPIAATAVGLMAVAWAVYLLSDRGREPEGVARPETEQAAEGDAPPGAASEQKAGPLEVEPQIPDGLDIGIQLPPRVEANLDGQPREGYHEREATPADRAPVHDRGELKRQGAEAERPDPVVVAAAPSSIPTANRRVIAEPGTLPGDSDVVGLVNDVALRALGYQPQLGDYSAGMVAVPRGRALLGTDSETLARLAAEHPDQRSLLRAEWPEQVTQVEPYRMQGTEVTREQYLLFLQATGYPAPLAFAPQSELQEARREFERTRPGDQFDAEAWWSTQRDKYPPQVDEGDLNLPVAYVSYADAEAFAVWAGLRLPTEAEWVRAARGGSRRPYPGQRNLESNLKRSANIAEHGQGNVLPVGRFRTAGEFKGLYDLAGNVWEWTSSPFLPLESDQDNMAFSMQAENLPQWNEGHRILKGGSFADDALAARVSTRWGALPTLHTEALGFRCVRSDRPSAAWIGQLVRYWEENWKGEQDFTGVTPKPESIAILERWALARPRRSTQNKSISRVRPSLIAGHNYMAFLPDGGFNPNKEYRDLSPSGEPWIPIGFFALGKGTGCRELKPGLYRTLMTAYSSTGSKGANGDVPTLVFLDNKGRIAAAVKLRFPRHTTGPKVELLPGGEKSPDTRVVLFRTLLPDSSPKDVGIEFGLTFESEALGGFPQ